MSDLSFEADALPGDLQAWEELVVVKLGGTTLAENEPVLAEVAHEAARRSLVLVHGGGQRLTEWLARLGVESRFEGGLRVTDDAALEVALAVFGGLALALADRGDDVRLVSIDPAHSLADLFDAPADGSSPCTPRLVLEEVDAEAHARRSLDSLGSDLREIIDRGTYLDEEDAASLVEGSTPGLDEIGAALRLAELTGRPGRLVVDTAPTGHTLRLLDSPAVVRSWIRVFEAMAAKADTVASALVGRAVRLSGEAALEELARAMDGFEDLVRRADFVLITGAGAVIRAETARLRAALETRGLRVAATVAMDRPGADADVVLPLHRDLRGCEALRAWTRAGNGDPEPARPTADAEGARPPPSSPGRREPHPAVLELMDRELVLFAGKGGVGKSTCAAAAALVLAESGPILLAGADPAGSLRDVLPDPPPGVEVRELEAEAELEQPLLALPEVAGEAGRLAEGG